MLESAGTQDDAILVVDDSRTNRTIVTQHLLAIGYTNIVPAINGADALEHMRRRRFDLVFLDIEMPVLDGFGTLEAMQADPALRQVPVIVISAVSEMDSIVRAISLGAEDFLPKPFEPVLLRARTRAVLEKKQLRDRVQQQLALLSAEIEGVRRAQLDMVPKVELEEADKSVSVYGNVDPAYEVGGDLCDWFEFGGVLCFAMGDVAGKGAPAALTMARAVSIIRTSVAQGLALTGKAPRPAEIARLVNDELSRENDTMTFLTLVVGYMDLASGEIQFCNAGHLPPYRLVDGVPEAIETEAQTALGIMPGLAYRDHTIQLPLGASLFLYTDGVTEAENRAGEQYGFERLAYMLRQAGAMAPHLTASSVREDVDRFADGADQNDDLSILVLRRRVEAPVRFTLSGSLQDLDRFDELVEAFARARNISDRSLHHIKLVFEQLISNIIRHGGPRAAPIKVKFSLTGNVFTAAIRDTGVPVDIPEPNSSDEPRSIHMLRGLTDRLAYRREGDRNRVAFEKRVEFG